MAELDVRTAALQSITMTRYVEGFTREMIEGFGEKNAREFLGQALDHLLETAAMLGNVSDRLASHTGEAEPTVFIDFKQATDLLAMFGGEPNEITLHVGEGHSGRGMYASYTDMPEEGTIFLGNSDQEAMPDTPSAAIPAAPSAAPNLDRAAFEAAMVAAGYDRPERGQHANSGYLYQRDEDRFVGWSLASHTGEAEPVAATRSWPKKATPEMIAAFKLHFKEGSMWTDRLTRAIEAMLEAAPPAATPAAPGEVTRAAMAAALDSLKEVTEIAGSDLHFANNHEDDEAEGAEQMGSDDAGDRANRAMSMLRAALSNPAPVAAPPSVPQAIDQLVSTLAESKGWMRDYARALIEDAIDRRHLEVAAPAPASEAVAQSITIDFKQATELLEMFGDEPCEITLTAYPKDEHHFEEGFTIAAGLYAHYTECPEEGGNYLGVADHDAVPAGDSAGAPVQQAGGERMSFEKAMVAAGYNKPERGAHANSGYLYQRDEDRFVGWELRAALKGEQPVEPSGSERGEV